MQERYRPTSPTVVASWVPSAGATDGPLASASPAASGALGEGCWATISLRAFHEQPEPEGIPEVFRPVEPRSVGGDVVVIEQGRRPADKRKVVLREAPQGGQRFGGGGAVSIRAPQSIEQPTPGEPGLLASPRAAQPSPGNPQRATPPAAVRLRQQAHEI